MTFIHENVSSFQVLQRDAEGQAKVRLQNGEIQLLKTGGPYTIGNANHVYVGDIWVMAGQSNMRGHGFLKNYFTDPPQSVVYEPKASVHLFQSNETWAVAEDPTHRLYQSPRSVHHTLPDPTVRNPALLNVRGASLGLPFAARYKELNDDVPVGLVACAHGGTSMEDWRPSSPEDPEQKTTTLFGAMIDKINKVGPIAGVLFYQGESDTGDKKAAIMYEDNMHIWIEALRQQVRQDLPLLCVQLGRCFKSDTQIPPWNWDRVRFQQVECTKPTLHKNVGLVASHDCPMDDDIHLSAKGLATVGCRLAQGATLALQGKAHMVSPQIDHVKHEVKAGPNGTQWHTLCVSFLYVDAWAPVDRVQGFTITDKESNQTLPYIYHAQLEGTSVRLFMTMGPEKYTGRELNLNYGLGKDPSTNLVTTTGMALVATEYEIPVVKIM